MKLLGKLLYEFRFYFLGTILIIAGVVVVYVKTKPTIQQQLMAQRWCISEIEFNGKLYLANTVERFSMTGPGICNENIHFSSNGRLYLPGFNTARITGKWSLIDKRLKILQTDTFDFVYNGVYEIAISGNRLVLTSKQTKMTCNAENLEVNLFNYTR